MDCHTEDIDNEGGKYSNINVHKLMHPLTCTLHPLTCTMLAPDPLSEDRK
jgi:hypothetical protein